MMEEYCGEPQYAYTQYSADPQEGLQLLKLGKQPQQTCQENRLADPSLALQETRRTTLTATQETRLADPSLTQQETRLAAPSLTRQETQRTFSSTLFAAQETRQTSSETKPMSHQESREKNEEPQQEHHDHNQSPMHYYLHNQQPMQYYLHNQQPMHYIQQQPTRLVVEPSSHLRTQSQCDYLFTQLQKQQHKCHYFQELSLKQEREIQSLKDKLQLSDRNVSQLRGIVVGRIKYAESLKKQLS